MTQFIHARKKLKLHAGHEACEPGFTTISLLQQDFQ